jgi:hypothetical protein
MGNALPTALGGAEEETFEPKVAKPAQQRETPRDDPDQIRFGPLAAGPTGPSTLSPPVLPRHGQRVQEVIAPLADCLSSCFARRAKT